MKYWILLLLAIGNLCLVKAQNVNRVEYFVDEDPGFGKGTSLQINSSASLEENFNLALSIQPGMHQLFIRAQDNSGHWSITTSRIFFVNPVPATNKEIVKLEYFIDEDPGFGKATPVDISKQKNIILDFKASLSGQSISPGFHQLYIRALDSYGRWSVTNKRGFYIKPGSHQLAKIVRLEYFLETENFISETYTYPIEEPSTSVSLDFQADLGDLPKTDIMYTMSLFAVNEDGIRSFIERREIKVCSDKPAQANYTYQVTDGQVNLQNTSTNATTFEWLWGEDSTANTTNHSISFDEPGLYEVCLVASNFCNTDTTCQYVAVPGIASIYPNVGTLQQQDAAITIVGFGLDSIPEIKLMSEENLTISPKQVIRADSVSIRAIFDFSNEKPADYSLFVINNDGQDTLTADCTFSLLEKGNMPFDEWVPFELASGEVFNGEVLVPEADEIFVFVKKADRIGYSSTWRGNVSLNLGDEELATESRSEDFDLQLNDPVSSVYSVAITNDRNTNITGEVKISYAPDWLKLNEWQKGQILRPYGYDWKYFEIGDDADTLFFQTEGYGLWSTIEVFHQSLEDPETQWTFSNMGAGYAIQGNIPNPPAGKYYVRYKDSAVLRNTENGAQDREYLIYVGISSTPAHLPQDKSIDNLSIYEVGAGINEIKITGKGFDEMDSLVLMNVNDSSFYNVNTLFVNSSELNLFYDFSNLGPGEYKVGIASDSIIFHPTSINIASSVTQDLEVDIISRDLIRVGRYQKFLVRVTNNGNVNKSFISLFISGIPTEAQIRFDSEISQIDTTYSLDSLSFFETIDDENVVPLLINSIPPGDHVEIELSLYLPNIQEFELQASVEGNFLDKLDYLGSSDLSNHMMQMYEIDSLIGDIEELTNQLNNNSRLSDAINDKIQKTTTELIKKVNELTGSQVTNYCASSVGEVIGTQISNYYDTLKNKGIKKITKFLFEDWSDCINSSASTIKKNIWDPIADKNNKGFWGKTKKVFLQHDLYSNVFHSSLKCAEAVLTTPVSPQGIGLKLLGKTLGKASAKSLYKLTVKRQVLSKKLEGHFFEIVAANEIMNYGEKFQKGMDAFGDGFDAGLALGSGCEEDLKEIIKKIKGITSTTPEDKYGPTGFDQNSAVASQNRKRFVPNGQLFEYKIDYWNKEDATAPAAEVFIRDTLDIDFDISTFNFTEIGFLRWKLPLEGGQYFNVTVDMRPDKNLVVNVEGTLDLETREIYWVHRSLDPETMELPEDPTAGYLPPIDSAGYNLGWVNYTIEPKDSLGHNTVFTNQAHVNFDGVGPWGKAPPYGPYTNTIDLVAPVSKVKPLAGRVSPEFEVQWTGTDDGGGIGTYDIYVSENGGEFTTWLNAVSDTLATFSGEAGNTYAFYSVATDHTQNKESKGDTIEASAYVVPLPGQVSLIAPVELIQTEHEDEDITFSWKPAFEADSYFLQIAPDSLFDTASYEEEVTDTSALVTGLEIEKPYFWRAKAFNVSGESEWSDTLAFTISKVTGIEEELLSSSVRLYPNPSSGMLSISVESLNIKGFVHAGLYTIHGTKLKEKLLMRSSGEFYGEFDLSKLSDGVYIVVLTSEDYSVRKKVQKVSK